jgi:hypothetical protein
LYLEADTLRCQATFSSHEVYVTIDFKMKKWQHMCQIYSAKKIQDAAGRLVLRTQKQTNCHGTRQTFGAFIKRDRKTQPSNTPVQKIGFPLGTLLGQAL